MSFKHRKIDVVLTLVDEGQAQTLSGYRVSVSVTKAGGAGMSQSSVRIAGMRASDMNRFSTLGLLPLAFKRNTVEVRASDESGNMATIFIGTIIDAYADLMAAPDVWFNITAMGGMFEAVMQAPPSTFPGSVDAAVVLQQLAEQAGLNFVNNGVSVQLSKPYYPGAIRTQIQECIEDAGISGIIDDGTLTIWPADAARASTVPLISPETGMVGYPTYTGTGIVVNAMFNPNVLSGAAVQVQSSLPQACGSWNVVTLVHDLESEVPNGKWFTQMQLAAPGLVVIPTK